MDKHKLRNYRIIVFSTDHDLLPILCAVKLTQSAHFRGALTKKKENNNLLWSNQSQNLRTLIQFRRCFMTFNRLQQIDLAKSKNRKQEQESMSSTLQQSIPQPMISLQENIFHKGQGLSRFFFFSGFTLISIIFIMCKIKM